MKKTVAFSALLFSLFLGSCGGDDTPTAPAPTPTPVATSITLSEASLSFTSLGATSQLSATVTDQNGATMASATVTWATSDAGVATVSSTGLVTSVTYGTATITATSGSASATATVIVTQFYLAANGVTLTCSAADVGESGDVGGVTYTKRSKAQIDALVDAGDYASLATTCTSSVTDMSWMFYNNATSFNGDIGSWDVSSVTTMKYMFMRATAFNQNLSGWCVSLITSRPSFFDDEATSWVLARPVWGTCP